MSPDGLEERVSGRHPFQVIFLGGVAVSRAARVLVGQSGKFPVRFAFVTSQRGRRPGRFKRMRKGVHNLELERNVLGGFADEPSDSFRDDAPLLRQCPAFYQHLQVEPLRGQPFKRVLAYRSELTLVHVLEKALFKISITEFSSVVIPENALDMSSGQDLANDIEDRIIVEGVPDFLELLQHPL